MSYDNKLIAGRIKEISARAAEAALRAGRDPGDVRLMAVTKTVSPDAIEVAILAGQTLFGENYVNEARGKISLLASRHPMVSWHLIGHLQTNKAGPAVGLFDCIETLDSIKLASVLDSKARASGRRLSVFIQVNIGEDVAKFGVPPGRLDEFLKGLAAFPHLAVSGLMTITPWTDDPEDARPWFRALRELRDKVSEEAGVFIKELSMGMSRDFETAIEEGATIVRVGSAIFGPRDRLKI
ncbi:MAG: YggS family pyridoxal phosphate-dependent enzyme [Dissulfurimicrobium sp.]|uniref:YggS family pyridoxal phosphate-dependent enzyme n=1 Tax=Dissulfurimicrobium TaxID=1769732 RepID=UPI003C759EB6